MIKDEIKAIRSTRKELIQFSRIVGGGFLLLGILAHVKSHSAAWPLVIAGAVIGLTGFIAPSALKPLQKAWMTLAVLLGWVMTRLILSLLFFIIVTPIAMVSRLFGKQFLAVKFEPSESYWIVRKHAKQTRTCESQF